MSKHYKDEGMCQACEWGQCTVKPDCVAISNPQPKQEQGEPVAWRPAFDYERHQIEPAWNNNKPTDEDLEFWNKTKVGIEYAYKLKVTL